LVAADAAAAMLTGDQPTLAVDRMSVLVTAGLLERGDLAIHFIEAHDAVVWNIRPDHVSPGGQVGRAFRPAPACPQDVDVRIALDTLFEALVADFVMFAGHVPLAPQKL